MKVLIFGGILYPAIWVGTGENLLKSPKNQVMETGGEGESR